MDLYGVHVYRRGQEPAERRLRSDDRENLWSVSKTSATGASVRDYLMPRVFGPLAIRNPQRHTCPLGHPAAESDLFLRTSELARFGRLLLDDGRHELCIVSPPREAVVTITAHVEQGSARTSITALVTEELLNRL
jgi:hypothetical protein